MADSTPVRPSAPVPPTPPAHSGAPSGHSLFSPGPKVFLDPNMPRDEEGHVHHLGLKQGDVAPRILSVGDVGRAERIGALLEDRHV
jgi:uridine phosphorylase